MDVKDAVRLAKQYVTEIFAQEFIMDIGLEEVEFDDLNNSWSVTIGFSRPWDLPRNPLASFPVQYTRRSYKVVHISNIDGKVISVKNREVES